MRRLWARISCRHQWQERWAGSFDRYWECERCGAVS